MSEMQAPAGAQPSPATAEAEAITTKQRSQLQLVVRRFMRHRLAMGSLMVFLLIVAFAFLGPLFWPYGHTITRGVPINVPWFSDASHPLGTSQARQDVVGMTMRGAQQTLKVVFTVALIATAMAAIWGSVAGFYRGWVDALMMRFVDVILVIPLLVVVLAVAGNVRGGTRWWAVAVIIAAFVWPTYARVVRGVVLSLREQEFVEAARAMGASDARIIARHLIPNVVGHLLVAATLLIAITALVEAALSFLGFGIQSPDTSLGLMIQNARSAVFTRPWVFYPPGLMIILIALTASFIGDGLRDAFDPRQTIGRR